MEVIINKLRGMGNEMYDQVTKTLEGPGFAYVWLIIPQLHYDREEDKSDSEIKPRSTISLKLVFAANECVYDMPPKCRYSGSDSIVTRTYHKDPMRSRKQETFRIHHSVLGMAKLLLLHFLAVSFTGSSRDLPRKSGDLTGKWKGAVCYTPSTGMLSQCKQSQYLKFSLVISRNEYDIILSFL